MSNKQYSKPQVIAVGDAVKLTLGFGNTRRDFLGRRRLIRLPF